MTALQEAVRGWLAGRTRRRDADRALATEAHREAALAVLRQEAADVITRGAAELGVDEEPDAFYGGPKFRLVPHNPGASPLEVHADWSGTHLHVGHRRLLHELWQPDVEQRRRELSECIAAVIAGRYEERPEPWKGATRLTMTFHGPTRRIVVQHHSVQDVHDEPTFEAMTYEPY